MRTSGNLGKAVPSDFPASCSGAATSRPLLSSRRRSSTEALHPVHFVPAQPSSPLQCHACGQWPSGPSLTSTLTLSDWSGVEASSPSSRPCEDYHGSQGGGHEHMPRRRAWRGSFSISHLLMQRESRSSRMMVPVNNQPLQYPCHFLRRRECTTSSSTPSHFPTIFPTPSFTCRNPRGPCLKCQRIARCGEFRCCCCCCCCCCLQHAGLEKSG